MVALLIILLAACLGLLVWLAGWAGREKLPAGEKIQLQEGGAKQEPARMGTESQGAGADSREDTVVIPVADEAAGMDEAYSEGSQADGPEAGQTEPSQEETVTMVFAGDVYLSEYVLQAFDRAGGISGVLDEGIRRIIGGADYFAANQEFPFSTGGTAAEDKQFTFRLPPERVNILKDMGLDLVTLANNHALDYGTEALLDTCETLDGAGIRYVGAGADMDRAKRLETVEIKGKTIGFLGATRVIPEYSWTAGADRPGMLATYDPAMLLEEIRKAKAVCDYVVVMVHWGVEKDTAPQEYQRTMGRQYIEAGADLVIGSHPHVLQGIEYFDGKPVVYSLGNFVFGSSIPKTMLLQVQLSEEGVRLTSVPCAGAMGCTSEISGAERLTAFYDELQQLSFGVRVGPDGQITEAAGGPGTP